MRVLHIGAGKLYGGVETLLVTLARCRDLCADMEPEFAVCFEGRLSAELRTAGVLVHPLGRVRVRQPLSIWHARTRLRKLLAGRRFDAIVCHSTWPQMIFGPTIRSERLPLVFWLHDAANGTAWIERWASRTRPDLALCNSRFTASTLRNLYPDVPNDTIYYPIATPGPFSDSMRQSVRAELETATDVFVIVSVGRLEKWKGRGLLLEALALLRDLPNWTCWMVGGAQRASEDRYLGSLKLTAAKLGIAERVRFLGQRSDVARLLAAADVFCQPNIGPEPFGIVFIEALFAGLPVVTTAMGGALEIVDDSCGTLVEADDITALAKALANLLREPETQRRQREHGPARARALCDPGRRLAQLCTTLNASFSTVPPATQIHMQRVSK